MADRLAGFAFGAGLVILIALGVIAGAIIDIRHDVHRIAEAQHVHP